MIKNLWADSGIFLIAVSAFITFKDNWIPGGLITFSAGSLSLVIGYLLDRFSHRKLHP